MLNKTIEALWQDVAFKLLQIFLLNKIDFTEYGCLKPGLTYSLAVVQLVLDGNRMDAVIERKKNVFAYIIAKNSR